MTATVQSHADGYRVRSEGGRLRTVIVGAGMIGSIHRRSAAAAGAEVVGVLASSPARSQQAAISWGVGHSFTDLDEVAASDADVVHLCTPNATHVPFAERLLAAGKHVICEKPLATTVVDAERLVRLAEEAGVVATVPFVYRYHPLVREIRGRHLAGEFGDWYLLHGSYLQDWLLSSSSSSWRVDPAAGGPSRAFADIGSHWCDLVEWVTGERFSALTADVATVIESRPAATVSTFADPGTGTELVPVRTEDTAALVMRTARGVLAALTVSQVSAGRKNRLWFELDGSRGSAVFDQEQPESVWLGAADGARIVVRDPTCGVPEQRRLSVLPAGHAQGYAQCFDAFVADTYAAIRGDRPEGLPTFRDGLRSAHIVDAVISSAATREWTDVGTGRQAPHPG